MRLVRPVTIDDGALAASNIPEDDYLAWSGATDYAIGDRVMVIATDYHKVFESILDSPNNINKNPLTEPTYWLLVGSTNRWRMFDASPSEQASFGSQIAVSLVPGERVDTVALMSLSAGSVTITQTDAIEGLVYNQTFPLISPSGIMDWYAYFFEPIVRVSDFSISDLLPYASSTIGITLDDPGSTVLCGECVIGLSREIGGTQYGASVGISDYSIKQLDTWGNATVVERRFAKTGDFSVWVESSLVSEIQTLLAAYRATPIVYIGDDGYAATLIYGFYKSFSLTIAYKPVSICTLTIEGLA